jgi:hypothetical protein
MSRTQRLGRAGGLVAGGAASLPRCVEAVRAVTCRSTSRTAPSGQRLAVAAPTPSAERPECRATR